MIRKLWLKQYRNFDEHLFELPSEAVAIIGANNQGKSNFLESVCVLATGKSPFSAPPTHWVQFDQEEAFLGAEFEVSQTIHKLYMKIVSSGKRVVSLDGAPLRSFSTLKKLMTVRYLSADILRVFQESPDFRRQVMTRFLSQYVDRFSILASQYDRVIKQRNVAIKSQTWEVLDVLDAQVLDLAPQIVTYRREMMETVQTYLLPLLQAVFSDTRTLDLCYWVSSWRPEDDGMDYRDWLSQKLASGREKEARVGYSLYGPHRDDFYIEMNGRRLTDFFSRGINRMVAILLEVAELEALKSRWGRFPVLLLDDTFAELDLTHKRRLMDLLVSRTQVIYTSVLDEDRELLAAGSVVSIDSGELMYG